MADETFHHLATECLGTLQVRSQFFGDKNILENMWWEVEAMLEFSCSDVVKPLLDPNYVHHIELVDTDSDGNNLSYLICYDKE